MTQYILRRLLQAIPIMVGVAILAFLFVRLIPGDPARLLAGPTAPEEDVLLIRQRLGLDESLPVQFVRFFGSLLHGDLGTSIRTEHPVSTEVRKRFSNTMTLTLVAISFAILTGILAGVIAASKRNSYVDYITMTIAVSGVSTPSFWLGLMLILLFGVHLKWLPVSGTGGWRHLILPAFTLGIGPAAMIARFTRSSVLEVLSEDYIRTARAKGLPQRVVLFRHALRNALIPVITITGLQFGFLLGGAVVTESVFVWPGLGRLLITAVEFRDYPMIQGIMLIFALEFVLINMMTDVLYGVVNPQISYD